MNILHLLYSGLGGHGNVFFSLVKADEKKIFSYEVVYAGVEDVRNEYVRKSNAGNLPWTYIRKTRGIDIAFSKKLIAAIQSSDANIILLHGSRLILLAKIATSISKNNKKIVVRETQANHLKTWRDWIWLILAMLLADRMVFLTEVFKEEIEKKLSWINRPQKISVINNGIDLEFFKPASKPPGKTIVLGMQSRIIPIKDHSTLLNAFALLQIKHPKLVLQLRIAGEGVSLPLMKELAHYLGIEDKVKFAGMLDEERLLSFMQSLDIYIHASMGETMSTAIMQAMACRLPIIASDVPGVNNMIENQKTGILVPVKDEAALTNALSFIINNPEKAEKMKQAAFSFAQLNYSNRTMFTKYKAVFDLLH